MSTFADELKASISGSRTADFVTMLYVPAQESASSKRNGSESVVEILLVQKQHSKLITQSPMFQPLL